MICEYTVKKFCNGDISLIENYDKAISDSTQTWQCHHRRETLVSRKELIENGEYYNRPASELIFLTKSEHNALHKKGNKNNLGKTFTEEWRRNISESQKRNKNWLGKHLSEEAKRKISNSLKGHKISEETKQKMSDACKGRCWYNNGIKNVFVKECPEGFVKGMIKRTLV